MKVSKNSWHYRFNNYMQDSFWYRVNSEVFSTCSYVRTTIFSVLIAILKSLVIVACVVGILFVAAGMITLPLMAFSVIPEIAALVPFGAGGWGFALLMGVAYVADKATPFLRERKERRMTLLKQTLQDKKDGVCTLVEFE